MTATIEPTTEAAVARARQLLHGAAEASKQLEENVRALVAMRAWDVLGYENFSEMWEQENGFKCPSYVKVIAVCAMADEGMNTSTNRNAKNGHTSVEVGRAIGYSVQVNPRTGHPDRSSNVKSIVAQHNHGVPLDKISPKPDQKAALIDRYGDRVYDPNRRRPHPRRIGKGPDDSVTEGFLLSRREADEIDEIARKANLPKSEIYRQAVAEYLMRYRESRAGQS